MGMSKETTKRKPRTLTSLTEILSRISEYQSEEDQLSHSLTKLLENRHLVLNSVHELESLGPSLDVVSQVNETLNNTVITTAKTAERIGEHVMQAMELKSSLHSLHISIEGKDWESAARHCARAMSVPQEVLCGPFAEAVVPTSAHHLPPVQILQTLRERLLEIFIHNFQQACRSLNSSDISRFFKLFPAIGWEMEGLKVYSHFISELVRSRISSGTNNSSSHNYATAFVTLLENIAVVISQHHAIVDKYYGRGRMRSVVKYLVGECDQLVENLVQNWERERHVKLKLLDVSDESVTKGLNHERLPSDPRDIDKIISEITIIVGRWNLFKLFVVDTLTSGGEMSPGQCVETASMDEIGQALSSTSSQQLIEGLIVSYYIPFETWYLHCIINKAHRLCVPDRTQAAAATTIPDDVFYVLKVVMKRLLSMGTVSGTRKTLEGLRETMDREYVGVFRKRLDESIGHLAVSRTDKNDRESRFSLLVILNDLDVSDSYLQSLVDDAIEDPATYKYFDTGDQMTIKQCIGSFLTVKTRVQSTLRVGLDILFNQLLRQRLRNLVLEVFKDVSYILDDETYSVMDHQDYVRKRFIKAWELIVEYYKDNLTERNYATVFSMAVETLPRPLEKMMINSKFNELGAIRFDRDLRSIISYLSAHVTYSDVREKFVRLQQISILVNLDNEDVIEFYNNSGIPWKLSIYEAKAVVSLRI
ncbi:hypothetical protein APHAL10511_006989 [Amanita phalloides]|nr:hypothetical protein APHAL10511_006989 [Amanita phalloides]